MEMYLKHIIPNFILVSSMIYIWHKLLKKRINFKDPKLYITLIGVMGVSIFNYVLVNKFVRIITITIIFMVFFKFLFKTSVSQSIITPIFYQFILLIAESLFAIIISLAFTSNPAALLNSILGIYITNIFISFVSILLSMLKPIEKFYKLIIKSIKKIKKYKVLILCLVIIVVLNIIDMGIYYKIEFHYLLIFNVSLIIICFLIVIHSFKTQNNFLKVSDKYNVAIKSLKDYEEMITKYRIFNHENKNLLLTVRAMIINKEKDIPKYIDSIIEEKYNDDEKLLFKMGSIPSGGLRGIIYSEILKIKDNNINYDLYIDKNIRTVDLIEITMEEIIDICKIVGVFVDNAIEEVNNLQEKYIRIDLYIMDNLFNIKVTNNYKTKIEIDKMFIEGYTTKGKGHGYGLALVNKIIKENDNFSNKIEINKNNFSQILEINYTKKQH